MPNEHPVIAYHTLLKCDIHIWRIRIWTKPIINPKKLIKRKIDGHKRLPLLLGTVVWNKVYLNHSLFMCIGFIIVSIINNVHAKNTIIQWSFFKI